jgi:hypothetical protein
MLRYRPTPRLGSLRQRSILRRLVLGGDGEAPFTAVTGVVKLSQLW